MDLVSAAATARLDRISYAQCLWSFKALVQCCHILNKMQLLIQTQDMFTWNFQKCYYEYVFHQQTNGSGRPLEHVMSESGHLVIDSWEPVTQPSLLSDG